MRYLNFALVSLCVIGHAATAAATVLWQADFETGDLSQWSRFIHEESIELEDTIVFEGMHSGKVVIHREDDFAFNQNRVEFNHVGLSTGEGEDTFLSWWFYLPAEIQTTVCIQYWETEGSFQNTMDMMMEPVDGTTSLYFTPNKQGDAVWRQDNITINEWHQLVEHVHWSGDEAEGRINIWLDGQHVLEDFAHKTKPNGDNLFTQMGFHRFEPQDQVETIYIDSVMEGESIEDVLLQPPPPNAMPEAGAAGASAAGGSAGAGGAVGSGGTGNGVGPIATAGTNSSGTSATAGNAGLGGALADADSAGQNAAGAPSATSGDSVEGCAVIGPRGTPATPSAPLLLGLGFVAFVARRGQRRQAK